jgi:DnaJ-class molecular chaperone
MAPLSFIESVMKKKSKFPAMYNLKAIEKYPSEVRCPVCEQTGWDHEKICSKCDGYGVVFISKQQRMQLAFSDCVLDEKTATIIHYV